ncbi:MAG: MucR family transcriptional regulator, partial [Caulobacteraceae bacterium]|nr:MucR family transcriptional regulator [Caulobacteraceae bacterium]
GNQVRAEDLPQLIRSVHQALSNVGAEAEAPTPAAKMGAAQVRRSITPDALISFEDGKPYKQLKRHLSTAGLTPVSYREKWGLPPDYPMVAASYSAVRSALAKSAGLGRKAATPTVTEQVPEATPAKERIKGRLGLFGRKPSTK